MLPLQKCRQLLGKECALTDSQLELLRDQFYALAEVTATAFEEHGRLAGTMTGVLATGVPLVTPTFNQAVCLLSGDERYGVEERAAIFQFDGKMECDTAERMALNELWRLRQGGN